MEGKQASSVEYIRESDVHTFKQRTNKKGRTKLEHQRRKGFLGTKEFFKHQHQFTRKVFWRRERKSLKSVKSI